MPTFVTGAKDDLAAADVYTQSSSSPINKIQDSSAQLAETTKSASSLIGGKAMLSTLKSALSVATVVKGTLNKGGDPLSRLGNLTGAQAGLAGALRGLPTSMSGISNNVLSGIKGVGDVTTIVNGVSQKLKYGTDLTKILAAGQLINSVSCDKSAFGINDRTASIGAYSGVINTAMGAGIPGAFGAAMKCETNTGILNKVAASCLPGTIRMGDISNLASMAQKLAPGTLKTLNPSILTDFTRAFPMPTGMTTNRMATTYQTEVKPTFAKIQPDWMSKPRGSDTVINLTCVQSASPDFQQLMNVGTLTDPSATMQDRMMLFGSKFPATSVTESIQQQFPSNVMFKAGNTSFPVDPRSLVSTPSSWQDEVTIF
jgi:hypothetical protein